MSTALLSSKATMSSCKPFSFASSKAFSPSKAVSAAPNALPSLSRPLSVTQVISSKAEQWSAKKTIKEKSVGEIADNFGKDVRFGGFTRANELFTGRIAMIGIAGVIGTESVTGQGALSQINLETGLSLIETEDLLLLQIGIIAALAFAGFATGGQWLTDKGALDPLPREGGIRGALGLSTEGPLFGFTELNELFIARMAMMGFAITTGIEAITGSGPLAQVGLEFGLPSGVSDEILIGSALFFAALAVLPTGFALANKED